MLNRDNSGLHASLIGARQGTYQIPVYDDGFGPVWLYSESLGPRGIVRALSFSDAWDCVLDAILTPIPSKDILEAYGYFIISNNYFKPTEYYAKHEDKNETLAEFSTRKEAEAYCLNHLNNSENAELQESYEYQPNATETGIVSVDLNGHYLEELTPELLDRFGITLQIEEE